MPIFRGKNFVSAVSDYKDSVRVALRSNFPLASTTTVIDGTHLNDNDRILLAGQSSAVQNGIYKWDSTTQQLFRANDADSGIELTTGTRVYVEEGTHAKSTWTLITTGGISIGSTPLVWAKESRVGATDISGTYGSESKTLTMTVDETGSINSIAQTDINLDGGSITFGADYLPIVEVNEDMILDPSGVGKVYVASDLIPTANNTFSLGSPDKKWEQVYVGPGSLYVEDITTGTNAEITVDNGILFVNDVSGLRIGNIQVTETGLTTAISSQNITLGTSGDTGYVELHRGLQFSDGSIQTSASSVTKAAYGQFWSMATQTLASTSAAQVVPFTNWDLTNQMTVGSVGHTSRIIINKTGVYNCQFSAQIDKTSNQVDTIYIWFRKNGTDIASSAGVFTIDKDSQLIQSWNILLECTTAGDYFEIAWSGTNTTISMPTIPAQTSPYARPASPSVIVTVTPVSN